MTILHDLHYLLLHHWPEICCNNSTKGNEADSGTIENSTPFGRQKIRLP
ncbi:MAG: hypothetical protein MGF17_11430 [Trichodesmium sp. MAG_R04]|nr:hypothetical protein [Trichodesmium sp. MAG_R04]